MIAPLKSRLEPFSPRPEVESLDFHQPYDQVSQILVLVRFAIYAPPVWMQLFAATGDKRYLDFAVKNWWRTTDYLTTHANISTSATAPTFDRREANGKKIFWSRGNGWVMAG